LKKDVTFALNYAINKGFQIHPGAYEILERINVEDLEKVIKNIVREKSKQNKFLINQNDLETFLGIKNDVELENNLRVLFDPSLNITSAEGIDGYNALFSSRFTKLKKIMSNRPEAKMVKPISSIISIKSKEDVFVCGLVVERKAERNITKVIMEDTTGRFEGIIFDKDLQKIASSLLVDQFLMVRIVFGKNGGFIIKDIILPDVPEHPRTRSKSETYAVFLSDLHIGSKYFMEKEFESFVSWLSSPDPISRKIRFILVGGDVIDGVGIYPNQDKELVLQSVENQLKKFVELIDKIPKYVKIIIMPGNHDPGRRALPQPAIPKKYNDELWNRENFVMVGNPSMISLNGVKVLMFHGQSIDDIVRTTPGLSYDKPAKVMKHLLQARHLSPIYGSTTPIAPELEDMLTIDEVPDIFHTGHVHVMEMEFYRGVLMLNSGTWQSQTPFQASVGINPIPGVAIIVNLNNFKVFVKDFKIKN